MGKLIATRGLPGCGKSSWAEIQVAANHGNVVRVNKDLIRTMLHFNKWSKEAEVATRLVHRAAIASAMMLGTETIICDDTNLDPKVMAGLRQLAEQNNYEFEVKDFTCVPLDVCINRDARREGYARVGSKVILDMHNRYLNFAKKTDA